MDEPIRDDSDYIQSSALKQNDNDVQIFTLSDQPDPNFDDFHELHYTVRRAGEGSNPVTLTIELRQGITEIVSFTHSSLSTNFVQYEQVLTNAQGASITDFSDLEVTITASCDSTCSNSAPSRERVEVSWIELELDPPPLPPILTDVADVDPFTLEITWIEPLSILEISQYNLYREDIPAGGFSLVNSYPVGTTLVEDTGLTPSTTYSYYVTSLGIMGESIPSNIIQGTTTSSPNPDPPILNSVSTIDSQSIQLLWTEPADTTNIFEYAIFRDLVEITTVPTGTTTYMDIGLTPETTYAYELVSRGITGDSIPSNSLSGTTASVEIDPPILVDVATVDEQSLEIMWTEPLDTTNIFGYNLYREDIPAGGFFFINSYTVGENFATDSGLTPSTTYSYYLTSQGISGESTPSNIISGSTSSATYLSPNMIGGVALDTNSIEISWFEPIDTSNIFEYVLYRDDGSVGFIEHDRVPVGINTYIDLGLAPSTTYSYYTRSNGISGQALQSNVVTATTGTGVINPPSITEVSVVSQTSLLIIWNEPLDTSEITSYRITRSGDNSTFLDVGFEPVGSTSFFDSGLMPNKFYMYQIYSQGGIGESVGSNVVSAITAPTPLSQAPNIVAGNTDGAGTITILWDEPPNTVDIISYEIERRISGQGSFVNIGSLPVGTTTFSEFIAPSTVFEYRIRSQNSFGVGLPSNIFTITSSIDPTQVTSIGTTNEPNPTNTFPKLSSERFSQSAERFNISQSSMNLIITDIDVNLLNAYQIILKMNDGSYDSSQEMLNAGTFYASQYILQNDISNFLQTIPDKVNDATGGSGGSGNNPTHGLPPTSEDQ